MPSFAGEPWRAHCRVTRDNLGSKRHFAVGVGIASATETGDKTPWEGAPGASFTLTYRESTSGAAPPGVANTITVELRAPTGAQIGSTDWVNPTDGTTKVIHLDTDPLNSVAGIGLSGPFEVYMRVVRTDLGTYDVDSRGAGAGGSDEWAAGYFRADYTLASFAISNVAVAGAEPASWAALDPVHLRAVLSGGATEAGAVFFELKRPSDGAAERNGSSSSTTSAIRDDSWAGTAGTVGKNRIAPGAMQAASEGKDIQLTLPSNTFGGDASHVWAASGHPANWVRDSATQLRYPARITVDPRLHATHHFQINRTSFDTSFNDTGKQGLVSDALQAATRVLNARDEGLNGLGYTQTADPANPGTTESVSGTTATLDSEDGWTALIDVCKNGKPGGTWVKAIDITSPSDIAADTHFTNPSENLTAIADDPTLALRVEAGDPSTPDDHWKVGRPMVVGLAMVRRTKAGGTIEVTRLPLASDTGKFLVGSFNYALGRLETLASDGITWEYVEKPYLFSTAASPGDAWLNLYTFDAATTAQWGTNRGGYFVQGGGEYSGVYKAGGGKVDALGAANLHSKWHVLREAIGG